MPIFMGVDDFFAHRRLIRFFFFFFRLSAENGAGLGFVTAKTALTEHFSTFLLGPLLQE